MYVKDLTELYIIATLKDFESVVASQPSKGIFLELIAKHYEYVFFRKITTFKVGGSLLRCYFIRKKLISLWFVVWDLKLLQEYF